MNHGSYQTMIHPVPENDSDCANRLHILAEKTRLAILQHLLPAPLHVCKLAELTGVEQSLVSHHLRVMREGGLVRSRRDGKSVLYEVAPGAVIPGNEDGINLGCCQLHFSP